MRRLRWRRNEQLADWLPWLMPLDAGQEIILTNAGGLLRAARLEAPDLETASPEALVAHHGRLAEAFARLGTGWSVWLDQWRTYAPGYLPESGFGGCLAAQLVEASRRRQFTDRARPVFQNRAFLALHYVPQPRDAVLAFLLERDEPLVSAQVAYFRETTEALLQQLAYTMRGVVGLRGDDLASYLMASVSYQPRRVMMPTGLLAPQLAGVEWHTSPSLRIDGRHLATVEVHNFGSPSPLTCEGLHELPFEARWVTTLHGLDPDARRREIGEVRKRWAARQRGLGAILTEIVTKNPFAGRTDPEADRAIAQLDVMQGELAERPYALAHANVHVWSEDRAAGPGPGEPGRLLPQRARAHRAGRHPQQRHGPARRHAGQRHPGGHEHPPLRGSSSPPSPAWPRSPVSARAPARTGASAVLPSCSAPRGAACRSTGP